MPEPRRYRGAIVGLGQIAERAHLPGFRDHPGAAARLEIVAAVDCAREGSVAGLPVLPDLDHLEQLGPIDFVDICTPTSSHLPLSLAALERGYHVLCEKPVAVTRAEARRIGSAARAARRHVMACHQHRHNPAWRQARTWLDQGRIGRWHLAEFQVYRLEADRGRPTVEVPWRGRRDQALGGIVLDHGTHLIYQLLDAAGRPPQAVHAWSDRLKHESYDVEDTAQVVFRYPDRLAVLFLTWAAHHRETRIRFVGPAGSIEWRGGLLELVTANETIRLDYTRELDKASYAGWFGELFLTFAAALDRPGPDPTLMADLAGVGGVLEDIYRQSALTGAAVG
jgi:predicted dehydrogenase